MNTIANTITYQVRVRHSEGALVRVLGLTRRRRYDVVHLSAHPSPDGDFLDVEMTVHSHRPDHVLASQLAKLLDVSRVEVLGGHAQARWAARSLDRAESAAG